MTYPNPDSQYLQIRRIHRKQLQHSLALAAVLAVFLTGCGGKNNSYSTNPRPRSTIAQKANEEIQAVFYENTEQCEADIQKQQAEYQVLLEAHQQGKLSKKPTSPIMKVEDCAPQMQAALEEHNRNAPVYSTLADCQSEGLQCEATPAGSQVSGYRPSYGGTYLYPYGGSNYIYIDRGGTSRRIYQPRTVYRGRNLGELVTPHGRTVTQQKSGRTVVPQHTIRPAPARPSGTAAKGTIKGRSSTGFGSTFKSTGKGGK
ncbi:MAG: DUF1190 domain-containing protein [Spirulina sp.]